MKTNHDWSNDEFFIGRFPGIGKSLATTLEEKRSEREALQKQVDDYFARGGELTICPPCQCTSDEVVIEINKARSKKAAERNAREAA